MKLVKDTELIERVNREKAGIVGATAKTPQQEKVGSSPWIKACENCGCYAPWIALLMAFICGTTFTVTLHSIHAHDGIWMLTLPLCCLCAFNAVLHQREAHNVGDQRP